MTFRETILLRVIHDHSPADLLSASAQRTKRTFVAWRSSKIKLYLSSRRFEGNQSFLGDVPVDVEIGGQALLTLSL
jgi:hypothetical protein